MRTLGTSWSSSTTSSSPFFSVCTCGAGNLTAFAASTPGSAGKAASCARLAAASCVFCWRAASFSAGLGPACATGSPPPGGGVVVGVCLVQASSAARASDATETEK